MIEKLKQFIDKDKEIQQAILFGSYAKGTQTVNSDVDLAIQLAGPMTSMQKLYCLDKLQ